MIGVASNRRCNSFVLLSLLFVTMLAAFLPASAKVLQGGVEEEDENMRLNRPPVTQAGSVDSNLRLERPMPAPDFHNRPITGMVDTHAFDRAPMTAGANKDDVHLGLLKPADFGTIPSAKFDLGSERGSRELTLAWEAWHHQLSAAVYKTWGKMASVPGQATLRIIVTSNHHITPILVHSSGSAEFDSGLLAAVRLLDGNPGLTFPANSQRQQVSLEADYIAATDIRPGFSWVKNDYEHINQSY